MTNRRDFLRVGLLASSFMGLQQAFGAAGSGGRLCAGYGPLLRDGKGLMDLPEGFSYRVLSRRGAPMSDGFRVPGQPDGMAAFPGKDGRVNLVRNHELGMGSSAWGPFADERTAPEGVACYDAGEPSELLMPGGTSTLVYNPKTGLVEREFLSLFGTDRNCAGGPTPWGTWITCEEPENLTEGRGRLHGWCFEVDAHAEEGVQDPVPLQGLGRFRHEAIAVDAETGIVYLTEDRFEGLFYRFIPTVKGQLNKGGRLQALVMKGVPGGDSRNWNGTVLKEGEKIAVEWMDLDGTDSPNDDLRLRGAQAGATVFARGEGCWWGDGEVWFCCTNGGATRRGQLFRYRPEGDGGMLELFLEPSQSDLLTNGDNLTIAKNGDIIIAEDRGDDVCSLRGVTPDGQVYTLATNALNASELAGVCFSPDGETLFVNIQTPGVTLAITGDWKARSLVGV